MKIHDSTKHSLAIEQTMHVASDFLGLFKNVNDSISQLRMRVCVCVKYTGVLNLNRLMR